MGLAGGRASGSRRGWMILMFAATLAASALAIAAPAQAHRPYIDKAWGNNSKGELGDGTSTGPETCSFGQACSTTPVAVSNLSGAAALAAGQRHSLALLENGTVMAWGNNSNGELGDGTETESNVPVAVCAVGETAPCTNHLSSATAISAGYGTSMALLSNGTVVAWGENNGGLLGNGTTANSDVPVAVCAAGATAPCSEEGQQLKEVVAIASGARSSLALLSSGKVVAWGYNLGNGTVFGESSGVPVEVSGLSGVVAVAASDFSADNLVLLSNGKLMAWGENEAGQLGNGTTTESGVPVEVSGLSEVTAIDVGATYNMALLKNGTVRAWGANSEGQLGDGTNTGPEECGSPFPAACSKKPVAVTGLSGVTAIAAGGGSLALLSNSQVMAWGSNAFGQLGNHTYPGPESCPSGFGGCSTKPVAVCAEGAGATCSETGPFLENVKGIAAGREHSLALVEPPPPPTNLPELGRCVKVAGTGAYKYANCLAKSKTHTGAYEWLPGPGTKNKYEATLNKFKLETASGLAVQCGGFVTGQYTGPKTATVELELKGCGEVGTSKRCQSGPEEGEINAPAGGLEAELGFIKGGTKPIVGWDLKPKEPSKEVLSLTCGIPPEATQAFAVEGSAIGELKKIDKMTPTFLLTYTATGGKQQFERFEGGLKDTLLVRIPPSTSTEPVGLTTRGERVPFEIENGENNELEPLEIKAK